MSTQIDHATPERLAFIRATEPYVSPRTVRPANGLCAKPITDRADPLVDIEYQKRADRAWDAVREMGNRETVEEA